MYRKCLRSYRDDADPGWCCPEISPATGPGAARCPARFSDVAPTSRLEDDARACSALNGLARQCRDPSFVARTETRSSMRRKGVARVYDVIQKPPSLLHAQIDNDSGVKLAKLLIALSISPESIRHSARDSSPADFNQHRRPKTPVEYGLRLPPPPTTHRGQACRNRGACANRGELTDDFPGGQ